MIAKRTREQLAGFEVTVICWNCGKEIDEWIIIYPPDKEDGITICLDCGEIIGRHANE